MNDKSTSPISESLKNTSEEVPVELFELSEEDLQQIIGGLSLWDRFTGAVKKELKAADDTIVNLVTNGNPPPGLTTQKLLDPVMRSFLRGLGF
jgi:bacteriocin-like protein